MLKHTAGPWEVMPESWAAGHVDISSKTRGALAVVVVKMEGAEKNDPEGEANAHLIGAAPELLAALVALTSNPHLHLADLIYRVKDNEGKGWDGPAVTAWNDAVLAARAAILKATGGAPQ